MDQPSSVSVEQVSGDSYRYTFDRDITSADLSWLTGHRNIDSYDVQGKTLMVTSKGTPDWTDINNSFITPGLKRTFGSSLKVDTHALSAR